MSPYQLLDDGYPPEPCEVLVVGCGNILRGDDAVGPILVRELAADQAAGRIPSGVRLVDGGTAGMDVAFGMRGAKRVVLVDAATAGNPPGTLYRLPASAVAELPPLDGLHSHNFRWDHALAFADWLLGPQKPSDITVFLVEGTRFEHGEPLSPLVHRSMESLARLLAEEFWTDPSGEVELTEMGYLHLSAALAAQRFPADACLAHAGSGEHRTLELVPLHDAGYGGLVLKQRTPAGDRSLLVSEVLGFAVEPGRYRSVWDEARGRLVINLEAGQACNADLTGLAEPRGRDGQRVRSGDTGGGRARPMVGLPGHHQLRGGRETAAAGLPDRSQGEAGSGHRGAYSGTPTATEEAPR